MNLNLALKGVAAVTRKVAAVATAVVAEAAAAADTIKIIDLTLYRFLNPFHLVVKRIFFVPGIFFVMDPKLVKNHL